MTSVADSIIERWNKSFRPWSQNYIQPYKHLILKHCLFGNDIDLQRGHSSALREIEKNKGNIKEFVQQTTEPQHLHMLPSKILSDTYSFDASAYTKVHQTVIGKMVGWKPGTSNALSRAPLEIHCGCEHFSCKFRKYQLESMKKFIQATPGTKELRGQWSVNLADDSMMTSFAHGDIVILLKIGCFAQKLKLMYEENQCLRKNSKIRKQTLKTSCWGMEKTKNCKTFCNSIVIQENYPINLSADSVLNISPIVIYAKTAKMNANVLRCDNVRMVCGDYVNEINLRQQRRPFYIEAIHIPLLSEAKMNELRTKYKNNLLHGSKKDNHHKKKKKNKKYLNYNQESGSDSTYHPPNCNDDDKVHTNTTAKRKRVSPKTVPVAISMPQIEEIQPIVNNNIKLDSIYHGFDGNTSANASTSSFIGNCKQMQFMDTQSQNGWPLIINDDCHSFVHSNSHSHSQPMHVPPFQATNDYNHQLNNDQTFSFQSFPTFNAIPSYPPSSSSNVVAVDNNLSEIQQLRQQNEMLMQQVNDQQRQIDYLTTQMQNNNNNSCTPKKYLSVSYCDSPQKQVPSNPNPLKRRKICSDIMMPPAA